MRRITVIVASLFFLALMATAQAGMSGGAGITSGRYGAAQVFDVQRSPAFPLAGQNFTASAFAAPVQGGFPLTRYTIAPDQYVSLVKVSDTPCRFGLSLFDGNGLVRVIHASGIVYGLGDEGFLHVSDPDDFGTFVSNGTTGYVYGGSLSYTPTTGEATCLQADTYASNPTPIAAYSVGGPVSGLTGSGLVLQNNGGEDLAVSGSSYRFDRLFLSNEMYSVTVLSQPTLPPQTCAVSPGIGLGVVGSANVTVLAVNCINNFFNVRFRVEGLQDGSRVPVLESSLAQGNYPNGDWSIERANGASYDLDIGSVAGHQCSISTPNAGTLSDADSPLITITCDPDDYRIGGSASETGGIVGLAPGNTLRLRLDYLPPVPPPCSVNAGPAACKVTVGGFEEKSFTANGDFAFDTLLNVADRFTLDLASGGNPATPYPQSCTPGMATVNKTGGGVSGTVGTQDVTSLMVDCAPRYYAVEGEVAGIAPGNSVILRNNDGDDLEVTADGSVSFATLLANGSTYAVTVHAQPTTPNQTCAVQEVSKVPGPGAGVISGSNAYFGRLVCTTTTYTVGGSVSGLAGSGLVLQLNGGGNLPVAADGSFTFPAIADGSTYTVSVATQPSGPTQTCTVGSGSGTLAGTNVGNVSVTCATNSISVGGSASGLAPDNSVTIRKSVNGVDEDLVVGANGAFTFATPVPEGQNYLISVALDPTTPEQTCTVTNGFGTAGTAAVTNVSVFCDTNTYTVGGTVSGLLGSGLVLQLNGASDLPVAANGGFTFAGLVPSGETYAVSIATQPTGPAQTCTVSNGGGTVTADNISNVAVTCSTSSFTVGGSVSGLAGSGLVLQLNGGGNLPVAANGSFVFPAIADGSAYAVSVLTQPSGPLQTCSVTSGNGTLAGANISNVAVTCSTSSFTVGGSVSGLAGSGLVLQLNGGNNLAVAANGSFVFPAIADGSTYAVSVLTQPATPAQVCSVGSGSGTLAGANVSNVSVSCVSSVVPPGAPTNVQVSISGTGATISWTAPASNGGEPITSYTVVAQPSGLSCTVSGNPPPTSCQISGLQPNRQYVFTVTASNSAGAGSGGAATAGTPSMAPEVIPVDQPWALAALGLLMLMLGRRGMATTRAR